MKKGKSKAGGRSSANKRTEVRDAQDRYSNLEIHYPAKGHSKKDALSSKKKPRKNNIALQPDKMRSANKNVEAVRQLL